TPLPWRQVTVLLLFRISEPISFTVLFPFVYFMVRDFHVSDDPKEIGFYVGIVASVFSIAQLTTGMLWGFLSDRIGRRPILLMGVMGTVVCSVLFGLSKSLLWAVLVRILWGTLNGNASTSKTIMAEITDETNQAKGFSLLPMCWNLGSIMGPMIGGLLSNPVENIPSIFGDSVLFAEYPYLLPCLFCAVLSMGSWLMGFFFLEETLHKKLPQTRSGSLVSVPTYVGQFPQKVGLGLGGSPTLSLSSSSMSAASALVLACIAGYFGMSLLATILDDIYPIWSATEPELGGVGLSTQAIGFTLSISGLSVLFIQIVIYPKVQRVWGSLLCFRYGTLLYAGLALPIRTVTWIALIAALIARVCGSTFGFTSVNMLINNSVPNREALGTVNGFAQSVGSLARAIGPMLAGAAWSWSLVNG
ncbi:major facilitator superfamily domain-containing protein, partial [Dimargaris cristalligena]